MSKSEWIGLYWGKCLSVIAIICSVITICVSLPPAQNLSMDYIGVIVGILSLLVTILIGWQIFNYISFEGRMRQNIDSKITEARKEIEKDYIRGLVSTNLLLIPQYINTKNNTLIFTILGSLYSQLLKIEDYESADDVSMSVLGYFSFDLVQVDSESFNKIRPILEKISPHSNQTDLLLCKLSEKCETKQKQS